MTNTFDNNVIPSAPTEMWTLRRGAEEWPLDSTSLLEAAADGSIRPDDYVFNPLLKTWLYAKDVAELKGVIDLTRQRCIYCGSYSASRVRGLQGEKEQLVAVLLILFLFPIGLIYYFAQVPKPFCSKCKRRLPAGNLADSVV